jgi:hypothetical protein
MGSIYYITCRHRELSDGVAGRPTVPEIPIVKSCDTEQRAWTLAATCNYSESGKGCGAEHNRSVILFTPLKHCCSIRDDCKIVKFRLSLLIFLYRLLEGISSMVPTYLCALYNANLDA